MVLQSIRERLTGILAFAILGILIIPFALVGVTQYFTSDGGNIVAMRGRIALVDVERDNLGIHSVDRTLTKLIGHIKAAPTARRSVRIR